MAWWCIVSCPDSLSHAEKESGETRIQFWFPLNVRDVLWRSHNSTIRACIIIRVSRAELFASPKLQVHLAKLKRWIASSITCWTSGDQPSLSSFKSLSQSFFKRARDVGTVLQSDWPRPDLTARNQNWIRVSPDSFSACDKRLRGWTRD